MIHTTSKTKMNVTDRDGQASTVDWAPGQSLMEGLRDNDFPILASCGGEASCATCHVFLRKEVVEQLGAPSEDEQELLEEAEHFDPERSRLSCQVKHDEALDGLDVVIAPEEDE